MIGTVDSYATFRHVLRYLHNATTVYFLKTENIAPVTSLAVCI